MVQGSGEWMHARAGNVGASNIWRIMKKTRNGYSEEREKYMKELLVERLTGEAIEHYVNDAMQWGIAQEGMARSTYEAKRGIIVQEVGFILHPTIAHAGASPDGLVGEDGLLEIKCPTSATHIDTIMSGEIDMKYQYQMAWQMECTGRSWCDFVSYDPRLPPNMQFFCKRFTPEPGFIDEIRAEVIKFLAELAELEAQARGYKED